MNKAFNLLIVAALILGVACIFLITKYVDAKVSKARESAPDKEWVMEDVIFAKEPVTIGSSFTQFNVEVKSMPEDFVPANAIKTLEDLNDKIAMHYIPAGDMLLSPKVGTPSALPKASAVIPEGKRLITIGVDDQSAVGYTVKNGDFVDLVGLFNVDEALVNNDTEEGGNPSIISIGGKLSVTFLQKVEIFDIVHGQGGGATPTDGEGSEENPDAGRLAQGTTATFIVTPQEANVILSASLNSDSIYMTLRRYDDEAIEEQPTQLHAMISDLLNNKLIEQEIDLGPVEAPVAPKRKTVF